ncbi:MAG: MmgE/PrpD family protein [Dehalococcoidales bacterium]|nr:MmgE/PrpD family protein [Dehalococcoidales bacterium]
MYSFNGQEAIAALSRNVLNTRFEDIDPVVVDNTRRRVLDMIGCIIGGSNAPGNAVLADMVRDEGGKREATLLGYGYKGPADLVAMVNCIFGRSFDWGPLVIIMDNGQHNASHNSETTVPTAITLGASLGIDGKELIAALVAGDDLVARVQIGAGIHVPGKMPAGGAKRARVFDEWGTKTTFGAAAIAGRLLGLTEFQMKNTFGIAINMMAGAGGGLMEGAHTFKLSQGTAARSGINAAQLARGGWIGISDPLTSYYSAFTEGVVHPEMITADLGKKYYVERIFKPWPGGRPTNAATQLAITLAKKYDIHPDDVAEAVYRTSAGMATAPHYTKPYKVGYYPTGDALFSFVYAVANGLSTHQSKGENFTEEGIRNPQTQSLIRRVTLANLDRPEGVELEVRMKDGQVYREYLRMALGDPSNPLPREGLIEKFMGQVEFSEKMSRGNGEKIVELVEKLEQVDNVQEIIDLAVSGKK